MSVPGTFAQAFRLPPGLAEILAAVECRGLGTSEERHPIADPARGEAVNVRPVEPVGQPAPRADFVVVDPQPAIGMGAGEQLARDRLEEQRSDMALGE